MLDAPGRFHVLLPDVWVESREGELVVTRLRPSVLPLLRYRTGDRGEVAPDECPCGYRGWSITGLTGRRECLFRTPGGRLVDAWRLVWLFKHYPLHSFRLTQCTLTGFALEVVADRAVLEPERCGELVRVIRSFMERLDDPRTVRPAASARDEVPEELTERGAHEPRSGNEATA